jgi:hypothetical protein
MYGVSMPYTQGDHGWWWYYAAGLHSDGLSEPAERAGLDLFLKNRKKGWFTALFLSKILAIFRSKAKLKYLTK